MPIGAIIDSGPLLALLDRRELQHRAMAKWLREATLPLLTVDAVISELAFLLRRNGRPMLHANDAIRSGTLEVVSMFPQQVERIAALMERYQSVPMSVADAGLVCLSELHPDVPIITFDSDFDIYRRYSREVLPRVRLPHIVQEPSPEYTPDATTADEPSPD